MTALADDFREALTARASERASECDSGRERHSLRLSFSR
jgi:hypothetical protein